MVAPSRSETSQKSIDIKYVTQSTEGYNAVYIVNLVQFLLSNFSSHSKNTPNVKHRRKGYIHLLGEILEEGGRCVGQISWQMQRDSPRRRYDGQWFVACRRRSHKTRADCLLPRLWRTHAWQNINWEIMDENNWKMQLDTQRIKLNAKIFKLKTQNFVKLKEQLHETNSKKQTFYCLGSNECPSKAWCHLSWRIQGMTLNSPLPDSYAFLHLSGTNGCNDRFHSASILSGTYSLGLSCTYITPHVYSRQRKKTLTDVDERRQQ